MPGRRWRVNLSAAAESQSAIDAGARGVVADLTQVTFLDSTGLRCIVTADERARAEGRRIVIVRGPDAVQRVFAITRLEERLEMVDDASAVD